MAQRPAQDLHQAGNALHRRAAVPGPDHHPGGESPVQRDVRGLREHAAPRLCGGGRSRDRGACARTHPGLDRSLTRRRAALRARLSNTPAVPEHSPGGSAHMLATTVSRIGVHSILRQPVRGSTQGFAHTASRLGAHSSVYSALMVRAGSMEADCLAGTTLATPAASANTKAAVPYITGSCGDVS